jgi:hypothetical protein
MEKRCCWYEYRVLRLTALMLMGERGQPVVAMLFFYANEVRT